MTEIEQATKYFIDMFITPYKLEEHDKNLMINAFVIGYKTKEEVINGVTTWLH